MSSTERYAHALRTCRILELNTLGFRVPSKQASGRLYRLSISGAYVSLTKMSAW